MQGVFVSIYTITYPRVSLAISYKWNINVPYDLAIPLLAALFTIMKMWKQPKCSSTGKQKQNGKKIHTMEFFLVIKKKLLIYGTAWINLKTHYGKSKKQDTKDHILNGSIRRERPEKA